MTIISYLNNMVDRWQVRLDNLESAIFYLQKYEYLVDNYDISALKYAVQQFQKTADITKDGEIGPQTLEAMRQPRCGCPDSFVLEARASLQKWGINELGYWIESRDNDLNKSVWDSIILKAFESWSAVANLTFYQARNRNQANIILGVGQGPQDSFDGPGGVLAWAYLPPHSNFTGKLQSKFDKDEKWITEGTNGILLLNVSAHEFGHICGIPHIQQPSQLMNPFYNSRITKPQQYDIEEIQKRYGKPVTPTPTPEPSSLIINIEGNINKISIPGYRVTKLQ